MKKQHSQITEYSDERFIAQLGIVSVQSRIDADHPLNRRWTSRFTVGDTLYQVEGYAADFGRPRGVDTDVLLALETLFIRQGCPKDNTVRVSAYELVELLYPGSPAPPLWTRAAGLANRVSAARVRALAARKVRAGKFMVFILRAGWVFRRKRGARRSGR